MKVSDAVVCFSVHLFLRDASTDTFRAFIAAQPNRRKQIDSSYRMKMDVLANLRGRFLLMYVQTLLQLKTAHILRDSVQFPVEVTTHI